MIGKTRLYLTSDKKEYIDYEMINAIKVRLTGNFAMNVTRTPKGDVQGVSLNELCHELNDSLTLHIEGMDYNTKIKQIKVDGNEILLYSERANKSRVFAVPAIGENMTTRATGVGGEIFGNRLLLR